jgi:hypothetical protein
VSVNATSARAEAAREAVWRGLALRVLAPAKVAHLRTEPERLLDELVSSGGLTAEAGEALLQLVERRPREGSREEEALLDLLVLDVPARRALEQASFANVAVELGVLTDVIVADLRKTQPVGRRLEDWVIESGALTPTMAMQVFASQETRSICPTCLSAREGEDEACPGCRTEVPKTEIPGSAASAGIASLEIGATFAGHRLLARIAEGGMGVVFRARDEKLGREVALKVMRGGHLAGPEWLKRFKLEAEAIARIDHPNVVAIHRIDELAGFPYYTMDLVEGPTLDRYVRDNHVLPTEVIRLVRSVAMAVHHFHVRGIIHRDLKPANVLVDKSGTAKVIDFGIAKRVDARGTALTQEGDIIGTLRYMSPEQAVGRADVDTRTDVYALGMILYELLAGAPVWDGLHDTELLLAIQRDEPPPLKIRNGEVDVELEAIVAKATEKERERRYQSAGELAQDLDRWLAHLPIVARPPTMLRRAGKAVRRHWAETLVVATLATAALVWASITGYQSWRRQQAVDELLAVGSDRGHRPAERHAALAKALTLDPENFAARSELLLVELEEARGRAIAVALKLLEKAEKERDGNVAYDLLTDALAKLPHDAYEERERIELRKIDVTLKLARSALEAMNAALAEFLLRTARQLHAASLRSNELEAVSAEVRALREGR